MTEARDQASWPPVPPVHAGLPVTARCPVCGLDLAPHDAGGEPAVFVILILGALVVPLALLLESALAPPIWLHLAVWPPVIVGLAILMLRPIKAALVACHFRNLRHLYNE